MTTFLVAVVLWRITSTVTAYGLTTAEGTLRMGSYDDVDHCVSNSRLLSPGWDYRRLEHKDGTWFIRDEHGGWAATVAYLCLPPSYQGHPIPRLSREP